MSQQGVWDLRAPHGPITGPVNVALGCLLCAEVGQLADLGAHPWTAVGVGATGMAVSAVAGAAAILSGRPARVAVLRSAVWAAAAGWSMWGAVTSPWSWPQWLVLAGGTLAGGLIAAEVRHDRRAKASEDREVAALTVPWPRNEKDRVTAEWEARILRVCQVAVKGEGFQWWPGRTGFSLDLDLPAGGATRDSIARHAAALASDARLPTGCGVEVWPGAHRGAIVVRVATVDALGEGQEFDVKDLSVRSVNDPIRLGRLRNGAAAEVSIRYQGLAMIGQIGSGKTNTLNVLISGLERCSDVLLWGIDRTGGMYLPWQRPHDEGRAARPAFDRVASDLDEIDAMLTAAQAIIDGRKPAYADRMRAADDDKIPVGADVPQIVIIVDELGRLVRDREAARYNFATRLAAIGDTGRAAGVRLVACALRGVADYLPPEVKAQSAVRIAMRAASEAELAYLMGWEHRLSPEDAPYEGSGHLVVGPHASTPVVWRASRIVPSQVDAVAVATAGRRPELDAVSRQLADDATRGWYSGRPVVSTVPPEPKARPSVDDIIAEANRDRAARQAVIDAEIARQEERDELVERFNAMTKNFSTDAVLPEVPDGWSAGQRRLVEVVSESGARGTTVAAVAEVLAREGHVSTRQTVNTWMQLAVAAGVVVQPRDRGPYYAARFR